MCLFRKVIIPDFKRTDAHTGVRCGNPRERKHLEVIGVDGTIILKYVFNKHNGAGLDCNGRK
jgi:hypothetical protein